MTNPTEPTPPQPADAQPTDAQPTEAYPPADVQPTEAYPPADVQPTEAYPPAGQPTYGQPGDPAAYGQPAATAAYGQPAYGAPVADPAAVSVADRPRGLGWASLGLAIGGLVLVGAAFIPLAWVSLVLVLLGGLLLLVALVLGIVTLASKKQGAKGLGIAAIAVSVLGGLLWIFALTASLLWIGLAVAGSSSGSSDPEISVSEEATPGDGESTEGEAPTGTYDEEAYLAAVRPEILAIMQEIEPTITQELVDEFYTDDVLITVGTTIVSMGDLGGDAIVDQLVEGSEGMFTAEQATRFYETIRSAAEQYLVEE
ncbi:hypothetical protein [Microbacterium sp. SSM24]|uniref:hypothetical protein n=1 Tax=Microbacterium sp. SSM24 TaxID=2991714 RepID=UPI002227BE22|nr:hypothetical protein [Microbacterium sp. SSM24]MCW3493501.1 hypothetical protein [Microbacterium sp. SSM24]